MRASKKMRNDELLVTTLAASRLRMDMDRVPLWRGDHVPIKQLVEDFGRYLYLPRLKDSTVLQDAIRGGLGLITWEQDSFAYADSYDEDVGRYRGLRHGPFVASVGADDPGLLVKPDVARRQSDAEKRAEAPVETRPPGTPGDATCFSTAAGEDTTAVPDTGRPVARGGPTRFHGSVALDATRVGRDASRIADEVIAHLAALVGADVKVTLEIDAGVRTGVPENVVRIVTENSRTLKFASHGFESE